MTTLTRWRLDERGSLTLWMVGLALLVLAVGGISVDLWRAQAVRRELTAVADGAAFAGASGIDAAVFRQTGEVVLDPSVAERLAAEDLAHSVISTASTHVLVGASTDAVAVTIEGEVDLALLGLLAPAYDPLPVRVTATATPRLVP